MVLFVIVIVIVSARKVKKTITMNKVSLRFKNSSTVSADGNDIFEFLEDCKSDCEGTTRRMAATLALLRGVEVVFGSDAGNFTPGALARFSTRVVRMVMDMIVYMYYWDATYNGERKARPELRAWMLCRPFDILIEAAGSHI